MIASRRAVQLASVILSRDVSHLFYGSHRATRRLTTITCRTTTRNAVHISCLPGRTYFCANQTCATPGIQLRKFSSSSDKSEEAKKQTSSRSTDGEKIEKRSSKSENIAGAPKQSGAAGSRDPEMEKIHQEFVTMSGGGKPDPQRMWKAVPDEEASTDTGGYIKLEDIGIDPKEVDAVHMRDNENDERLHVPEQKSSSSTGKKETPSKEGKSKDAKKPAQPEPGQRSEKEIVRQKDHQAAPLEEGQDGSKHRRTVSTTQQAVVWETNPRSTIGSSQSSPESGGIELLTEQLLDREAAEGRSSQKTETATAKSKKDGAEKSRGNGDESDSDSDSDTEKHKQNGKKK